MVDNKEKGYILLFLKTNIFCIDKRTRVVIKKNAHQRFFFSEKPVYI